MLQKNECIPMGNAMHRRRMGRCQSITPASSGRFNRCTGQRQRIRLRQTTQPANMVDSADPVEAVDATVSSLPKSLLEEQKKLLELQLETINQSLHALTAEQ